MTTLLDNITITGITNLDHYPDNCLVKNCKQNITSISLCVPCQKPDMESINDIKISFCINSYKLLNTILGPKVVLNITAKIKVIYTAKNLEQSLHSAHWDIDFCDFILLENFSYNDCNLCSSSLFIGLEDVCVLNCDERSLELSLIYIICTNFNTKYCSNNVCKSMKDCEFKCIENCEYKKTIQNYTKPKFTHVRDKHDTYYYPVDYYENSSNSDQE